jgi:hypothetical protein
VAPRGAYCSGMCLARKGATVWPATLLVEAMLLLESVCRGLSSQASCEGGSPASNLLLSSDDMSRMGGLRRLCSCLGSGERETEGI